jgi:biopolymer transport protein ExbB/TolQ
MDFMTIIKFGLGSVGLVGLLMVLLSKFSSGNLNIDAFKKKQKEGEKAVEENIKESVKLEVKVKDAEKITEEKKEEIKKITESASAEIQKIINKKDISDIDKDVDDGWSKL